MGAGIDRCRDLLGGHCLQSVCGMLKDQASGTGKEDGSLRTAFLWREREREREALACCDVRNAV